MKFYYIIFCFVSLVCGDLGGDDGLSSNEEDWAKTGVKDVEKYILRQDDGLISSDNATGVKAETVDVQVKAAGFDDVEQWEREELSELEYDAYQRELLVSQDSEVGEDEDDDDETIEDQRIVSEDELTWDVSEEGQQHETDELTADDDDDDEEEEEEEEEDSQIGVDEDEEGKSSHPIQNDEPGYYEEVPFAHIFPKEKSTSTSSTKSQTFTTGSATTTLQSTAEATFEPDVYQLGGTLNEYVPQVVSYDPFSPEYINSLNQIGIKNIVKGAWGMTYSYYHDDRSCKSPEEIQTDIGQLGDFKIIRTYDTDCGALFPILKAMKPEQQLFAGVYYMDKIDESIEMLSQAIQQEANGDWSRIHTVSIGNELVNFNKATPLDIQRHVSRARELLSAKGYKGYVVSTDTLVAVLNHPELCGISDYISINSHPYWDGNVPPQEAGPWLIGQLQMLDGHCGHNGKKIMLCETGWPTRGAQFGPRAVPSKDNQLIAVKSIVDFLGGDTILFTNRNDYWKPDGSHGVEKFWGLLD